MNTTNGITIDVVLQMQCTVQIVLLQKPVIEKAARMLQTAFRVFVETFCNGLQLARYVGKGVVDTASNCSCSTDDCRHYQRFAHLKINI